MTLERELPTDLPVRTSTHFDLISAGLGFLVFGSWAFYVNRAGASPLVSGVTQGTGSFLLTLAMVRAVAWLYHRMSHFRSGLDLVLPAAIIVSVSGTCLASAHTLVGTPNIIKTISPALSVALFFNIFTATKLRRARSKGDTDV